jgi:hypothetical protein
VEAELLLELACECLEPLDVLPRVMNLECVRMDLAHGNVKVLMLLVAVSHRHVVVLLETDRLDGAAHHKLKLALTQ